MELLNFECKNCGAPIAVPDNAIVATCKHCKGQHKIAHRDGVITVDFVAKVKEHEQSINNIKEALEFIPIRDDLIRTRDNLVRDLDRIDEEWDSKINNMIDGNSTPNKETLHTFLEKHEKKKSLINNTDYIEAYCLAENRIKSNIKYWRATFALMGVSFLLAFVVSPFFFVVGVFAPFIPHLIMKSTDKNQLLDESNFKRIETEVISELNKKISELEDKINHLNANSQPDSA